MKRVGDISVALAKSYDKFNGLGKGGMKIFNEVQNGLTKFKETGSKEALEKIRGSMFEFQLINSLDNVVGANSNAREIAKIAGLGKEVGESLNKGFGDVTIDVVQKMKDGSLNLIEAKTGAAFSRAKSFAGLDNKKLKQITGKIDFAHSLNKSGGNASVEFRFSGSITAGLFKDIANYAFNKNVNVKLIFE